jgi:hypothetical protein
MTIKKTNIQKNRTKRAIAIWLVDQIVEEIDILNRQGDICSLEKDLRDYSERVVKKVYALLSKAYKVEWVDMKQESLKINIFW